MIARRNIVKVSVRRIMIVTFDWVRQKVPSLIADVDWRTVCRVKFA